MKIATLQAGAWRNAEAKGFHVGRSDTRDDTIIRPCLIHSEVSEDETKGGV